MIQEKKRLDQIKNGEKAKIISIKGGHGFQRKIACMGLREGKKVKMISRQPLRGPLTVKFGNCNVTIGRGMAKKIIVKKI
ncbi:MAG: FeoA family protein [Candidatus Thermoplasmatota archaeon]